MGKRGRHVQVERAAARDMPDEIDQVFDMERASFKQEFHEWLRHFQRLMRIKHGSDVEIDITHNTITGAPHVRLVTAFVKKPSEAAESSAA